MFDRFTDRARKVMAFAREEASLYDHAYIGTEHIFIALVREGGGVASNALARLGIGVAQARNGVTGANGDSPAMLTMGQLPFTPRTKRSLALASEWAQKLNHNYIGTEHLLLGIIEGGGGAAIEALKILDVQPTRIKEEILSTLGVEIEPAGTTVGSKDDPDYEEMVFQEAEAFFDRYQEFTGSVAVYPGAGTGNYEALTYVSLKGAGECGEFAEKLGKRMRKAGSISAISRENMSEEFKLELVKELGDRLWYISQAAAELGFKLSDVARINRDKLSSRKDRGVLVGEGDNR